MKKPDRTCSVCGGRLPPLQPSWEFFLPIEPPSQNVVHGNSGGGRFRYSKLRRAFELLLMNQRVLLKIPRAKGKRRVSITRLYSGRGQKRDLGNIVGGCKLLLDAMTRATLLVDDAPEYVEVHYYQERAREPGVLICVEEMR